MQVEITPDELRYLIACGVALAQNIPEKSLPTYCDFNKQHILEFSRRMRRELDGLDLICNALRHRRVLALAIGSASPTVANPPTFLR